MSGIPITTLLSLILAVLGVFTAVISVTMSYCRRNPNRLQRLEFIQEAAETARWPERPVIWEVRVEKYPKQTSKLEDLAVSVRLQVLPFLLISCPFRSQFRPQPLSMTYDRDQSSFQTPWDGDVGWGSVGGTVDVQPRPGGSNEESQPNPATTDCSISVFIVMPTGRKHISTQFGDDFVIGTAEVVYRHPKDSHS